MAAEKVTPRRSRSSCVTPAASSASPCPGPAASAQSAADGRRERGVAGHRVHRHRRLAPRHEHWNLGGRPRHDHPCARKRRIEGGRLRAARSRLSAASARRRRPAATRPHRGGVRSGAARGPRADRSALRAHAPRRHHDAPSGARGVRASHGLPILRIDDLVAYRRRTEVIVEQVAEARLPTRHGLFGAHVFRRPDRRKRSTSRWCGATSATADDVLVRVHSECLTGDIFGSLRCDCGAQLDAALGASRRRGEASSSTCAVTRGAASASPTSCTRTSFRTRGATPSRPTSTSVCRSTRAATTSARRSWRRSGCDRLRLMSNNPASSPSSRATTLRIVERVPLVTAPHAENAAYLRTKQRKLGHLLGRLADRPTATEQPSRNH